MKTNEKCKMKNEIVRILQFTICILPFSLFLAGCVAFEVGGEIQKGRMELMYGSSEQALSHFQRAADLNPDYLLNFSILDEGVWTYVGRSYYATGKLPEALKALERARSRYDGDYLARLYLGLVLARQQERERALREVESGLSGLEEWLIRVDRNTRQGSYWDPGRKIRSEIQKNLAMIKGKDVNWQELTRNIEWIGREIEEEVDRSRRDERMDRDRESSGREP